MTQPDDDRATNSLPPVEIQPSLKMALYIQQLQNNPLETPDDWEAAIKAWDDSDLTLGNNRQKKES